MNVRMRILLFLWAVVLFAMPAFSMESFNPGERVVILGDSITHFGKWWPYVWCGYAAEYPDNPPVFISAGCSGDTATGALGRLDRDVFSENPDAVCVMFGMNDVCRSSYTEADTPKNKADQKKALEIYEMSMDLLLKRITEKGVRCVVVTPSPYDQTLVHPEVSSNNPGCNDGLAIASQIAQRLAEKYGCDMVDFQDPMTQMIHELQAKDPSEALIGLDRIHPGNEGSLVMAKLFLEAQGIPLDGLGNPEHFEAVWEHADLQRNILNIRWIEDRVLRPRGVDMQDIEVAKTFLRETYKARSGADRQRVKSYLQWKGREEMLKDELNGVCSRLISLSVPAWFGDHMMLPANYSVSLSGCAAQGAEVTVEFANQKKTVVADSSNHWNVFLDPMPASSIPKELIVSVAHQSKIVSRKFADVLTGDIWLCSGQSNMQRRVKDSDEADEAVRDIQSVVVRYFNGSRWMVVNAGNVEKVSAVGAYFAMEMAHRQNAPVGIFVAARGGTGIEAWMPVDAFPDTERGQVMRPLASDFEVLKAAEEDATDFRPYGKHRLARWGLGRAVPSALFRQLVQPFADLPVCGVVWYQGEANSGSVEQAQEYRLWLENLISAYRNLWGNPELPFVIIQLPEYDPGTESGRAGWAALQNAQAAVAEQTESAEVVDIKDLGDLRDIHPRRKKEVGLRAADVAWKLVGDR